LNVFLILEVVCVLLIAVGLALWFTVGAGMVAAGGLGLVLVVAAQVPDFVDGEG
jgi:hypothetical protein